MENRVPIRYVTVFLINGANRSVTKRGINGKPVISGAKRSAVCSTYLKQISELKE